MATILEQENDITLGEGEEFGNLDELGAVVPEEQQEPVEASVEPVDEPDLDIPEKFRGKGLKDIIKSYTSLEQEFGRKSNEVGELRRLADEIIKQNLELNTGGIPAKKKLEVDDLLEDPEKAISSAVENNPRLKQLEERLINEERAKAKQAFENKHPDWVDVVNNPQFQSWVTSSPMRTKIFQEANASYDYQAGAELLDLYKEIYSTKIAEAKGEQKAAREKALKAATVEKGSTGQSSKKIFKRDELMNMIKYNREKYNDPAFQAELVKAYAEGRVR